MAFIINKIKIGAIQIQTLSNIYTLTLPQYSPLASAFTTITSNLTFLSNTIDIELASSTAGTKSTSSFWH